MKTIAGQRNTQETSLRQSLQAGLLGGLGGGFVFGMMMGMMGMLPRVATLAGAESPVIGFLVHMAISAVIGVAFGVVAHRLPPRRRFLISAGAVNGIVWWLLGALIIMPLALGMPGMVLSIGMPQWMSLMGHLIFGIVAALVYARFLR